MHTDRTRSAGEKLAADPVAPLNWLGATLLCVAAVHALLLLTLPGPFWDGWIYTRLHEAGDLRAFLEPFVANGRPLGGWVLWWAMEAGGTSFGPRAASMLLLIAAAGCAYLALRWTRRFAQREAFLVAVVSTTVPATQTAVAASALQFFAGFALFFAGLALFAKAATLAGSARAAAYMAAVAAAALSVAFAESPLALMWTYPATYLLAQGSVTGRREALLAALRHSAPVAAGVAAIALTFLWYPTTGSYEGSHSVQLAPAELARSIALYPVAILGCELPLLAALAWAWRRGGGRPLDRGILLGALALLAAGLAPYALAGRWPAILGWGTRALLLSGPAIGLLAVAVLRSARPPLGRQAVTMLALAAIACLAWRYPLWAARQWKDDTLAAAIAASPLARSPVSTVWVEDPNWVIAAPYRPYEWTALVQGALQRRDVVALEPGADAQARQKAIDYMVREHHLVSGWAPGCEATVRVAKLAAIPWLLSATMAGLTPGTPPQGSRPSNAAPLRIDVEFGANCATSK